MMKTPELFVQSRNAMGTAFTIYLYTQDAEQAEALFEVAFDEVNRLDETFSNYRATSELSRINRLAAHQAVTTDPEVFALLEASLAYSRQTEGAFDVTVGPLMRTWGFFRGQGRCPSDEEMRVARENVGFDKVHLDPTARAVHFACPGVELDLGAIGKGYAVDRTVKVLRGSRCGSRIGRCGIEHTLRFECSSRKRWMDCAYAAAGRSFQDRDHGDPAE